MADIDLVIKTTLETATGLKAYPLQKPIDSTDSCVVYQIVAERKRLHMSGKTDVKQARVQITSIANSYSGLKSIISNVEDSFVGTTSGWLLSFPLDTKLENKENDLFYSISEYYIYYK